MSADRATGRTRRALWMAEEAAESAAYGFWVFQTTDPESHS